MLTKKEVRERDGLSDALRAALEEQIVPTVFTQAQLAEHKQLHAEAIDYYHASVSVSGASEAPYNLAPQLGISDPRITDEALEAAAKMLTVQFNGKALELPVRVYRFESSLEQWEKSVALKRKARGLVAAIEGPLKEKFSFIADGSFGHGINPRTKEVTSVSLSVRKLPSKDKQVTVIAEAQRLLAAANNGVPVPFTLSTFAVFHAS